MPKDRRHGCCLAEHANHCSGTVKAILTAHYVPVPQKTISGIRGP